MKSPFISLFFIGMSSIVFGNADSLKTEARKKNNYRASVTRHTDLIHTRLDVKFDWQNSQLSGRAAITARPFNRPASTLTLNARGMEIKDIEVYDLGLTKNQKPGMPPANAEIPSSRKLASSFKYENDSIKLNLGREFKTDEKYLVKINYVAKPNELKKGGSDAISDDRGLFFINPRNTEKNKMPQIWTQGETQASSAWFPTIDSPNEKMTNEIFMTVENKYTTLSNGTLADSRKNADGSRTDHWKMDLPHSPYLVMMGVGEFKKVTDAPWNGKEISYYVEKEYEPYARDIFGSTKEMIDFYSKVLGTPYPWQKYAQIVVRDYVSGAMENTSATLHGDFMVYQTKREMIDGHKGENVISHELFHQWFGDLVTAESWSNLPLNESFATYGEYLWQEYKHGRDAADAHSYESRQGYFAEASRKQVDLIRYHYDSREDMFDAFSYNKGGQVLHMLRKYTGDKAFFESLRLYLERNKFKSAEIHDLRLAFEEVTGEDLNWFFNQWFLSKGHPELEISKNYDQATRMISISVKQKQSLAEFPLYTLPVDVDVYSNGKTQRHRIVITEAEQQFNIPCEKAPDLVNFDAERQLLGLKTYTRSTEELIFQYHHAPLFSDRLEALVSLKGKLEEPGVLDLYKHAAEKDAWFELRGSALFFMKPVAAAQENVIKPLAMKIASTDKNTNVREHAIQFISENYKGDDADQLYINSLGEQSYAISSMALKALVSSKPTVAVQKAKLFENEKNLKVFAAVGTVYSKAGSDENRDYFEKNAGNYSGYDLVTYVKYYGKFLSRCNNAKTFETAADIFSNIIKTGNEYVSEYTVKAFNEQLLATMPLKVKELNESGNVNEAKAMEMARVKAGDLAKSFPASK